MKHTSKRLQALVLVLAMCVSFLQIPSFATACISGDKSVVAVDIAKDGTITVTKRCKAHLNEEKADCEETVNGKIGVKVKEDGNYEADSSKTDVSKLGLNATDVTAICTDATCKDAGSVKYTVKIAGETREKTYTTVAATGKHDTSNSPKVTTETEAKAEVKKGTYALVNDTATCQAAGKVTYAKVCKDCKQPTAEVVSFDSARKPHTAKKVIGKDGKETDAIDYEREYIKAPTCKDDGLYYNITKCKYCGASMNYSDIKTDDATGLHNYEYTVSWDKKTELNGKNDTLLPSDVTIAGKCSVCGDTIPTTATDVQEVKEKTVEPTSNCQPGSKTFIITYKASTPVKGKLDKKTDVKVEATIPYYPATHVHGTDGHVRTGIYVPDEESYVKATCTKDGHYNMVNPCKVCGDKEVVATVKIPATGKHTAAAAKKENVVAATTKKGGSYDLVVRCADCGEIISSTHKTTAKIVVKASKINSVKNYKGKKAKITVKKAASVTGYQIQYGTKKNFKGAKSVKTKATTKTVSKLAKKKYYVRVRTYKVVSGKTYYSSWSGAKTVTIKK